MEDIFFGKITFVEEIDYIKEVPSVLFTFIGMTY